MNDISEILALSAKNQKIAHTIIKDTNIISIWESIGATVNLIGSLKMGTMAKYRDIDFHIYSSPFSLADSFAAMAKLAENPAVKQISYSNLLQTDDACVEWHAWYEHEDGVLWQIDMMHILKDSRYDGYFERVSDRIIGALTDETREAILRLKFDTPDGEKIMGIEYYKAVIADGVRSFDELRKWREQNPVNGILEWMP